MVFIDLTEALDSVNREDLREDVHAGLWPFAREELIRALPGLGFNPVG